MIPSSTSGSRGAGLAAVQVALFLAAICTPLAVNLTGVDGGDPRTENRELATLNEGVFAWFADHFGLRSTLVRLNAEVEYSLNASPSSSVIRVVAGVRVAPSATQLAVTP